jgi:hypothetical protein
MSDQRPWLKLWKSAYTDSGLMKLTLEDQARWFRLLLYIGLNGERGSVLLRGHERDLLTCFWTTSQPRGTHMLKRVTTILDRMPGITYVDAHDGLRVTFTKWQKYQEDSSASRMRAHRDRRHRPSESDGTSPSPDVHAHTRDVTVQEEKRRDTPISPPSPPSPKQPDPSRNYDCPNAQWHGRCVNRAWVTQHPGERYPVSDEHGTPKQCAHHASEPT